MKGVVNLRLDIKAALRSAKEQNRRMLTRLWRYFVLMAGILLVALLLFNAGFGLLADVSKTTQSVLNAYAGEYSAQVASHFDNVAARGVRLSKELSAKIDASLAERSLPFSGLNDNRQAISEIQREILPGVQEALLRTNASGVYFMMDCTVNTALPDFYSGVYLKIAVVTAVSPVDPKIVYYKGDMDAGRQTGMTIPNLWEMEFDVKQFSCFQTVKAAAAFGDLDASFYYSPPIDLLYNGERAIYLCVPVFGEDGTFYGVCGFEISRAYYNVAHHVGESDFSRVSGFLSQSGDGFESGMRDGYVAGVSDGGLMPEKKDGFTLYTSPSGDAFIGVEKPLTLSPLVPEETWTCAVMIPKSDYDALERGRMMTFAVFAALLLAVSALAAVILSRRYVKPIAEGLRMVREGETDARSGVSEIDDLMDFLAEKDEEREAAQIAEREELEARRQELEKKLAKLSADAEEKRYITPTREAYEEFLLALDTLTPAEREVFDLYVQGHRAKDMPKLLYRSMNTIKMHNKRINDKLAVSSRDELMGYIKMMKEEGEVTPNEDAGAK
jgi:DNA-binding NarL/FixJ family response regulator